MASTYLDVLNLEIAKTELEIEELRSGARRLVARGNKSLARQFRAKADELAEDLPRRKAMRDLELVDAEAVAP